MSLASNIVRVTVCFYLLFVLFVKKEIETRSERRNNLNRKKFLDKSRFLLSLQALQVPLRSELTLTGKISTKTYLISIYSQMR